MSKRAKIKGNKKRESQLHGIKNTRWHLQSMTIRILLRNKFTLQKKYKEV